MPETKFVASGDTAIRCPLNAIAKRLHLMYLAASHDTAEAALWFEFVSNIEITVTTFYANVLASSRDYWDSSTEREATGEAISSGPSGSSGVTNRRMLSVLHLLLTGCQYEPIRETLYDLAEASDFEITTPSIVRWSQLDQDPLAAWLAERRVYGDRAPYFARHALLYTSGLLPITREGYFFADKVGLMLVEGWRRLALALPGGVLPVPRTMEQLREERRALEDLIAREREDAEGSSERVNLEIQRRMRTFLGRQSREQGGLPPPPDAKRVAGDGGDGGGDGDGNESDSDVSLRSAEDDDEAGGAEGEAPVEIIRIPQVPRRRHGAGSPEGAQPAQAAADKGAVATAFASIPTVTVGRYDLASFLDDNGWWRAFFKRAVLKEVSFSSVITVFRPRASFGTNTLLQLREFSNVPFGDLQAVMPCRTIQLPPLDTVIFVTQVFFVVVFLHYSLQTMNGDDESNFFVLSLVLAVGLLQRLFALVNGYIGTVVYYENIVEHWVDRKREGRNTATVAKLTSQAIGQECKEIILAYLFLWRFGPLTADELEAHVERFLRRDMSMAETSYFEVNDAIAKLIRMGLAEWREQAPPIPVTPRRPHPPAAAADDDADPSRFDANDSDAHAYAPGPPPPPPPPASGKRDAALPGKTCIAVTKLPSQWLQEHPLGHLSDVGIREFT